MRDAGRTSTTPEIKQIILHVRPPALSLRVTIVRCSLRSSD